MSREFFNWLEDWAFNINDNIFIGFGKMLVVIVAPSLLVLLLVVWWWAKEDAKQPHIILTKSDWSCVHTHSVTTWMPAGKVIVPITRDVCDVYLMNGYGR